MTMRTPTITAPQAVALLTAWRKSARDIEQAFAPLTAAFGDDPETPFRRAVWDSFHAHTAALCTVLGDQDGWLDWFAWECDFGRRAREATFSDGEKLLIVGPADLLAILWSNGDGTRAPTL